MDKWKEEIIEQNKKLALEIQQNNDEILTIPSGLTDEEKTAYEEIVISLKSSIRYKLSQTDCELIWQYCQIKIMRDKAWRDYCQNPDRYIRIVTGICSDGKTPKVMFKENDNYKTLTECNKQLERILKDLRLTPDMRRKK